MLNVVNPKQPVGFSGFTNMASIYGPQDICSEVQKILGRAITLTFKATRLHMFPYGLGTSLALKNLKTKSINVFLNSD